MNQNTIYTMAMTRLPGLGAQSVVQLLQAAGDATTVYENRHDPAAILPEASGRVSDALGDWSAALSRAEQEVSFMERHHVEPLVYGAEGYPRRLMECPDAPPVLYWRGTADLNRARVVSIVGTRHATAYGADLVRHFVSRLSELCPQVLVVSGLAYGIDVNAHRQALSAGLETVAVVAHGLDTVYPTAHRQTAIEMLSRGGMLTEYMTQTQPIANNFRQRNRIVAGLSDATVVVESAVRGGSLITARIAQEYDREVMAFPGAVGAEFSEGCNRLIRSNRATLITSADDFMATMGWASDARLREVRAGGIERTLFPDLSPDEQAVVDCLVALNDQQLNTLCQSTGLAISAVSAALFSLEMKGLVKPLAGGIHHLLL